MRETFQSTIATYFAITSPKPEPLRIAGERARIAVSARITDGCRACRVVLKLFSVMGDVPLAKPSMEGAVAKIAKALSSRRAA